MRAGGNHGLPFRLVWLTAVLLAVAMFAATSLSRQAAAQGYFGDQPLPGNICQEGEPFLDICAQCGNNGERACDPRGRYAECSESPSGFHNIGGICGRNDPERGDTSIRNCGFPGFPICQGDAGTVECQVGTPDRFGSGLCLACGDYGQACCSEPRQCDFGACSKSGICVKIEEPDISGVWSSNIGFKYEIHQRRREFDWTVIDPEGVEETATGTVERDPQTGEWVVNVSWSGSNGSGSATGRITGIQPDHRAYRIKWSNGVNFDGGLAMTPPAATPDDSAATAFVPTFEPGTDRMGMDYSNFDLDAANPELCHMACVNDPACKAWTYVSPPKQGPKPRCWLKTGHPKQSSDPLCTSGLVRP